jgi:hypothetical protein
LPLPELHFRIIVSQRRQSRFPRLDQPRETRIAFNAVMQSIAWYPAIATSHEIGLRSEAANRSAFVHILTNTS